MNLSHFALGVCIVAALSACSKSSDEEAKSAPIADKPMSDQHYVDVTTGFQYLQIEWEDLIPEADKEALNNPPEYLLTAEEEYLTDLQQSNAFSEIDDPYQRALVSTNVIQSMDNQAVRVPGFIVPLEFTEDLTITEFFLVPFFGACIHVPPPAPNQIIHVSSRDGIQIQSIYEPFWLTGILTTEIQENELGKSAYSLALHTVKDYYTQ